MEQKKQYPKDIGCIWRKESSYGEYLSIQVEIEGKKHNFTAFINRFYEPGGKKPFYTIPAPKIQSKPAEQVDRYQKQLDNVLAQKAAMEKRTAAMKAIDETQGSFTESDVPF